LCFKSLDKLKDVNNVCIFSKKKKDTGCTECQLAYFAQDKDF